MAENVKKKNKFLKALLGILLAIAVFVCGVIIYFNVTHNYYVVYGPSMSPTLNNGIIDVNESKDGVFVSKVKSYTRGDIIVLDKNYGIEGETERFVIKRLIAIEGDKINVILYDGNYRISLIKAGESEPVLLEEEYLLDYSVNQKLYINFNAMINELSLQTDESGYITIPENNVFIIGDNRNNSADSSTYGPKHEESVVGKVDYIAYGNTDIYLQVIKQFFGWN